MTPRHEVRTRKLHGSPHICWSLRVDGVEVRAQLHPFSADQIADALAPQPAARVIPPFTYGKYTDQRKKPGPKPKGRGPDPAWADYGKFDEPEETFAND
jgi:hypothetical protein